MCVARAIPLWPRARGWWSRGASVAVSAMTVELTELNRPSSWAIRGIDGPVRGIVKGTIEELGNGERSRVTIALDFEGHGIGKLLVPLVVRRQARTEMPRNQRNRSDDSRRHLGRVGRAALGPAPASALTAPR